jgi:hypothetical protein
MYGAMRSHFFSCTATKRASRLFLYLDWGGRAWGGLQHNDGLNPFLHILLRVRLNVEECVGRADDKAVRPVNLYVCFVSLSAHQSRQKKVN